MNALPVIVRELRAQARHTSTYGVRTLAGAVLLGVGAFVWWKDGFYPGAGLEVFARLHWAMFVSIWCLVPLLAADCLSREKREGTLGLLFLTPLCAWEIVLAKGLVHGVRGFALLLAALPITAVPLLLGGVAWQQVAMSFVLNTTSLGLALMAGVLASAYSRRWGRALAAAGLLAVGFYLLFCLFEAWLQPGIGSRAMGQWQSSALSVSSVELLLDDHEIWALVLGEATARGGGNLGVIAARSGLLLAGALLAGVALAAGAVRMGRQEKTASPLRAWCEGELVSPLYWQWALKYWLRRTLERNPVGWLERRTWGGRSLQWTWLAVLLTLWFGELTHAWGRLFDFEGQDLLELLGWLLAGTLAVHAAGSFSRERENGVMELLLVTPLGEGRIITGRLRGLGGQFLPAALLLLGLWLYAALVWQTSVVWFWFFAVTFLTLPATALYFPLRCRHRVHALAWTVGAGLVLPLLANGPALRLSAWLGSWERLSSAGRAPACSYEPSPPFWALFRDLPDTIASTLVPMAVQVVISVALGLWLRHCLAQRKFVFQRH
jgi:ABC-type transport system involved in multi-copper enzyme maturation permease subunit